MGRFFLFFLMAQVVYAHSFVDQSEAIFFPKKIGERVHKFKSFPSSWWDFFILEYSGGEPWKEAGRVCDVLKREPFFGRVECEEEPSRYENLIKDWASDLPKRVPLKGSLRAEWNEAYARASLPMPEAFFRLLRSDPFESYRDLLKLLKSRLPLHFQRSHGFLVDEGARKVLIPVQGIASTERADHLGAALKEAREASPPGMAWGMLGPDASEYENRTQIKKDLHTVSQVGTIVLLIFCAFLFFFKKVRLLWLVPIVFVSTLLGALTTILLYGSIHGLTLSFGAGIVGLSIDYGLLMAFNPELPQVRRSTLFGFLTTLVCLVVIMASGIPLLRQLMVFSASGFTYAYFLLGAFRKKFPNALTVPPLNIKFGSNIFTAVLMGVVLLGLLASRTFFHPNWDLRQFNYQSESTARLGEWFYKSTLSQPPLFRIHDENVLQTAEEEVSFANNHGIFVENIAQYLPPLSVQEKNLATWRAASCKNETLNFGETKEQRILFKPFLDSLSCEKLEPFSSGNSAPAYLNNIHSDKSWLTLWFPKNENETRLVKSEFPDATSLLEVVSVFPNTLSRELLWMVPLSLLLVAAILFYYYRKISLVLIGMVPFLAGVGLVAWGTILFHFHITFMSLIALVMILGLSVDYSIFAIDFFRYPPELSRRVQNGTATALLLASFTTMSGFLPLVFCEHRVLAHLGQTLTLGTFGTVLASFWAVPWIMKLKANKFIIRMRTWKGVGLAILLVMTWAICVVHRATCPSNSVWPTVNHGSSTWIPKSEWGINQLVLSGSDLERGLLSGEATKKLMYQEEENLQEQVRRIFPSSVFREALYFFMMRWFWGVDRYLDPRMLEEMRGVSKSASSDFNYLADPFTRQIAYHGLHEVGQTMVDLNPEMMGCTVLASPHKKAWIVGRNFDFEAGRIFDEEKIMKWVFPNEGYPFVSVIWAGMVGGVTGVNSKGVYISINAAGSTDFRRLGTPSTLVWLKAIQFAKSAQEARKIIEDSQMFITDIFVVADEHTFLRIEKSPLKTRVIESKEGTVVTNHLIHPDWASDRINHFRKTELTSEIREARGKELISKWDENAPKAAFQMLGLLRDKKALGGGKLSLGNRGAIDGLIATHSVIYDGADHQFFVGVGPSLSGPFLGFDLNESFRLKRPVRVESLPRDPLVSEENYAKVKGGISTAIKAEEAFTRKDCDSGKRLLKDAESLYSESPEYYFALGQKYECDSERSEALRAYKKSLELRPPYEKMVRQLERRVSR